MRDFKINLRCVAFTLLVASSFADPASVSARTWHVRTDGTGDALTIQGGVDLATAGDMVLVGPGVYDDTLHVDIGGATNVVIAFLDKDIVLRSEVIGAARIDITDADAGVVVSNVGPGGKVAGFEFTSEPMPGGGCVTNTSLEAFARQGQLGPNGRAAIWCEGASCSVDSNYVHDAQADTGVYLNNSPVTVRNNTFVAVVTAVELDGTTGAQIRGNNMSNCAIAIFAYNSSTQIVENVITRQGAYACRGISAASLGPPGAYPVVISGNRIESMENESIFCNAVSPTISGNTFVGGGGVDLENCDNPQFMGNIAVGGSYGVHFVACIGGAAEGNTMDGTGVGIAVVYGSSPVIERNAIVNGRTGIECQPLGVPVSPTISCNDIFAMSISLYSGTCADQTGIAGNISADPQFCGVAGSGNYELQSDSPCAPGNHPDGVSCGTIGALGVGCGTVSAESSTWGRVKSLYRQKGE